MNIKWDAYYRIILGNKIIWMLNRDYELKSQENYDEVILRLMTFFEFDYIKDVEEFFINYPKIDIIKRIKAEVNQDYDAILNSIPVNNLYI